MLALGLLLALFPQPVLAQGGVDLLGRYKGIALIIVDICIGLGALLLALGFGVSFVRGMLGAIVGRPVALSDAWAQAIAIAICGIGVMLTVPLANMFIDTLSRYAGKPLDTYGFSELGQTASEVLGIAIGVTALLVAVDIAVSFVKGEISTMAGLPAVLGDIWLRIMAVVICLLIAVFAAPISRMIVAALGLPTG